MGVCGNQGPAERAALTGTLAGTNLAALRNVKETSRGGAGEPEGCSSHVCVSHWVKGSHDMNLLRLCNHPMSKI